MDAAEIKRLKEAGLNPESEDKFAWKEGDVQVYDTEEEYRAAMLDQEIERTDTLLRAAGVDPDDPEATLGDLDEEE